MKQFNNLTIIFFISFLLACEKNITIELPDIEQKIVIEGHIEPGSPPYVILTRATPYFSDVGISTFDSLFVHDAVVVVSDGINTVTLDEFCANDLDTALLPLISGAIGIPVENLINLQYCIYSKLDFSFLGVVGKTYKLTVTAEGKTYSSTTNIPELIPLDSLWFKLHPPSDSTGFIWAHLTDPDTLGNAYRWFAKIQGKDNSFLAPLGSIFDDKFLNGKSFDFFYDRSYYNQHQEEEHGIEDHFYKTGDTIIVKFCTIDKAHYDFWRTFETEVISGGNPFAAPATIKTNIEGGALGVWGGYGATYDTTVATK